MYVCCTKELLLTPGTYSLADADHDDNTDDSNRDNYATFSKCCAFNNSHQLITWIIKKVKPALFTFKLRANSLTKC